MFDAVSLSPKASMSIFLVRFGKVEGLFLQRVLPPVNYFSAELSFVDNVIFPTVLECVVQLSIRQL